MNNEEKNKETQNQISAEMEARVVAWVSGEATPAESAELERLVAGNPALATFKGRIEAVKKLAAEGMSPDAEPMRMSGERRAALLREIGGEAREAHVEAGASEAPTLVAIQRRQSRERQWMLAVAACLTAGLFLSLMIPSFQKNYSRVEQRESVRDAYQEKAKSGAQAEKAEALEFDVQAEKKEEVALSAPRAEIQVQLPAMESPARAAVVLGKGLIADSEAAGASKPLADDGKGVTGADLSPVAGSAGYGAERRVSVLNSVGSGTYAAEGRLRAAPGEKAGVESEAPTVLDSYAVDEPKEGESYRANSTLAGTRVRTDLKDVSSSISVVTDQFLQDTGSLNGKILPANSPKTEIAGLSGSTTTTTTTAAPDSPNEGAMVLSPFVVEASEDKGSYKAIENVPVSRTADAEFQAAPNASDTISVVTSSIGSLSSGKGSPSGVPDSVNAASSKAPAGGFGEVRAEREPVSTFSLHVSDVSFRLAQAELARGEAPDPAQIRPEEFYNAFNYGDPVPAMSEKIACHTEQSVDPVMQQRNLLRIAMRVPTTGHGANQPLRLTVLLDTSGSMEREDRAVAVASAMRVLVSLLGRDDRVTLIGFARSPRLLAEQVHGDKAGSLLEILAKTPADGGTNLEEAIKLGSELAQRQFTAGAQNRVVLLTDGAANLGDADPAHLAALVESLRQRDIAFDACGVGAGGIDDSVLEALTRKGSGRYYVLDGPEAADEGFARQLAGAFRPAAENVKVQVRFNPARVGSYRLIGFENHRLKSEDFHNDKVAAAALASGEAAVALYEVEALPQGDGDLGEVYVRFHDTATGRMVERSWALPYDPYAPAFDKAAPSLQLAGTAALLAEKLRGGPRGDAIKLAELAPVVNSLRSHYSHEAAVQELAAMYQQMRRMRGE
jgi:hypothetical protein